VSRVISRKPAPAEFVALHTCTHCDSVVEYERTDLWHGDQRDPGSWSKCPVCERTFDATRLDWKPKESP
jgi:hypothetical protein